MFGFASITFDGYDYDAMSTRVGEHARRAQRGYHNIVVN